MELNKVMNENNKEIEVRFLEIDYPVLTAKLKSLNAQDFGEDLLKEIIFYDKELTWQYAKKRIVRIRETKDGVFLTFKSKTEESDMVAKEIEMKIDNADKMKEFLEEIGLVAYRLQEKKRHTFKLKDVIVDIDTWPSVPTYVELEGPSEDSLRQAASSLDLDWKKVVLQAPRFIIEEKYKIPVSKLRYFTFNRID